MQSNRNFCSLCIIGIFLSHFELSAGYIGLEEGWVKHDSAIRSGFPDIEYKISWIGK